MARKLSKKQTKVKKVIKKARSEAQSSQSQNRDALDASPSFTPPNVKFTEGVGRRKVASARVRLYQQPGDFIVNDIAAGKYFDGVINAPSLYNEPLQLTELQGKFTIVVKVAGSGVAAQLDAVRHGIARALVAHDPELKPILKKVGLLTRDDRMKETRKIGMGGKARRKRQSPKR